MADLLTSRTQPDRLGGNPNSEAPGSELQTSDPNAPGATSAAQRGARYIVSAAELTRIHCDTHGRAHLGAAPAADGDTRSLSSHLPGNGVWSWQAGAEALKGRRHPAAGGVRRVRGASVNPPGTGRGGH